MFNFPQLWETKSYFWLNSLHLPLHIHISSPFARARFYYQISLLCVITLAITLAFSLGKQFRTEFVFLNSLIYHAVLKKGREQYLDVYISHAFKYDQPDGELILTLCEYCIPYTCKIKDI